MDSSPKTPVDHAKTICFCHNVSWGKLLEAIESGSNTLELIKADTCASTGCGGCECDVERILEQALEAAPAAAK
jgi:nitrite reductase (NADH) large subunit